MEVSGVVAGANRISSTVARDVVVLEVAIGIRHGKWELVEETEKQRGTPREKTDYPNGDGVMRPIIEVLEGGNRLRINLPGIYWLRVLNFDGDRKRLPLELNDAELKQRIQENPESKGGGYVVDTTAVYVTDEEGEKQEVYRVLNLTLGARSNYSYAQGIGVTGAKGAVQVGGAGVVGKLSDGQSGGGGIKAEFSGVLLLGKTGRKNNFQQGIRFTTGAGVFFDQVASREVVPNDPNKKPPDPGCGSNPDGCNKTTQALFPAWSFQHSFYSPSSPYSSPSLTHLKGVNLTIPPIGQHRQGLDNNPKATSELRTIGDAGAGLGYQISFPNFVASVNLDVGFAALTHGGQSDYAARLEPNLKFDLPIGKRQWVISAGVGAPMFFGPNTTVFGAVGSLGLESISPLLHGGAQVAPLAANPLPRIKNGKLEFAPLIEIPSVSDVTKTPRGDFNRPQLAQSLRSSDADPICKTPFSPTSEGAFKEFDAEQWEREQAQQDQNYTPSVEQTLLQKQIAKVKREVERHLQSAEFETEVHKRFEKAVLDAEKNEYSLHREQVKDDIRNTLREEIEREGFLRILHFKQQADQKLAAQIQKEVEQRVEVLKQDPWAMNLVCRELFINTRDTFKRKLQEAGREIVRLMGEENLVSLVALVGDQDTLHDSLIARLKRLALHMRAFVLEGQINKEAFVDLLEKKLGYPQKQDLPSDSQNVMLSAEQLYDWFERDLGPRNAQGQAELTPPFYAMFGVIHALATNMVLRYFGTATEIGKMEYVNEHKTEKDFRAIADPSSAEARTTELLETVPIMAPVGADKSGLGFAFNGLHQSIELMERFGFFGEPLTSAQFKIGCNDYTSFSGFVGDNPAAYRPTSTIAGLVYEQLKNKPEREKWVQAGSSVLTAVGITTGSIAAAYAGFPNWFIHVVATGLGIGVAVDNAIISDKHLAEIALARGAKIAPESAYEAAQSQFAVATYVGIPVAALQFLWGARTALSAATSPITLSKVALGLAGTGLIQVLPNIGAAILAPSGQHYRLFVDMTWNKEFAISLVANVGMGAAGFATAQKINVPQKTAMRVGAHMAADGTYLLDMTLKVRNSNGAETGQQITTYWKPVEGSRVPTANFGKLMLVTADGTPILDENNKIQIAQGYIKYQEVPLGVDEQGHPVRVGLRAEIIRLKPAAKTIAEVVRETHVSVGTPLKTQQAAQLVLQALVNNDRRALHLVGISGELPANFYPNQTRWAMGRRRIAGRPDEFVIVKGQPDGIDFSDIPDLIPMAHSNSGVGEPLRGPSGRWEVRSILTDTQHGEHNRDCLLPSASDQRVAMQHPGEAHTFVTGYKYDPATGHLLPATASTGVHVTIEITDTKMIGYWQGTSPVYQSRIRIMANGQVISGTQPLTLQTCELANQKSLIPLDPRFIFALPRIPNRPDQEDPAHVIPFGKKASVNRPTEIIHNPEMILTPEPAGPLDLLTEAAARQHAYPEYARRYLARDPTWKALAEALTKNTLTHDEWFFLEGENTKASHGQQIDDVGLRRLADAVYERQQPRVSLFRRVFGYRLPAVGSVLKFHILSKTKQTVQVSGQVVSTYDLGKGPIVVLRPIDKNGAINQYSKLIHLPLASIKSSTSKSPLRVIPAHRALLDNSMTFSYFPTSETGTLNAFFGVAPVKVTFLYQGGNSLVVDPIVYINLPDNFSSSLVAPEAANTAVRHAVWASMIANMEKTIGQPLRRVVARLELRDIRAIRDDSSVPPEVVEQNLAKTSIYRILKSLGFDRISLASSGNELIAERTRLTGIEPNIELMGFLQPPGAPRTEPEIRRLVPPRNIVRVAIETADDEIAELPAAAQQRVVRIKAELERNVRNVVPERQDHSTLASALVNAPPNNPQLLSDLLSMPEILADKRSLVSWGTDVSTRSLKKMLAHPSYSFEVSEGGNPAPWATYLVLRKKALALGIPLVKMEKRDYADPEFAALIRRGFPEFDPFLLGTAHGAFTHLAQVVYVYEQLVARVGLVRAQKVIAFLGSEKGLHWWVYIFDHVSDVVSYSQPGNFHIYFGALLGIQ